MRQTHIFHRIYRIHRMKQMHILHRIFLQVTSFVQVFVRTNLRFFHGGSRSCAFCASWWVQIFFCKFRGKIFALRAIGNFANRYLWALWKLVKCWAQCWHKCLGTMVVQMLSGIFVTLYPLTVTVSVMTWNSRVGRKGWMIRKGMFYVLVFPLPMSWNILDGWIIIKRLWQ